MNLNEKLKTEKLEVCNLQLLTVYDYFTLSR